MPHTLKRRGREKEGGRKGGKQGGREGGREGGRKGGKQGGREGGREGGMKTWRGCRGEHSPQRLPPREAQVAVRTSIVDWNGLSLHSIIGWT